MNGKQQFEEAPSQNTANINGLSLRLRRWPSSDESVFDQLFKQESYRPLVELVRSSNTKTGIHTILDAGANIGCSALYLSLAFPDAQIMCVESDDSNFLQLQENISINDLKNVSLFKAGLWSAQRLLSIDPRFRDGREWARRVYESPRGTVPGYAIPDLMQMQGWTSIDILKIDIEGAEKYLFDDRAAILAVLARVRFIAIEIHDEFMCRAEIQDILRAASFDLTEHGELTIGVNRTLSGG